MSELKKISDKSAFAKIESSAIELALVRHFKVEAGDKINNQLWDVVYKRIRDLLKKASASFEQRDEAVEVTIASFISGVPVLLLGAPGLAKSAIVRKIAALCGLTSASGTRGAASHSVYFEYLMTNHTMPEEIFGGLNLKELREGTLVRVVEGKLPRAEIAFLDEVFRGGSHILNTLLTIINEKRYDYGFGSMHVPLLGIVGASNRAPVDTDLEAFYDRFPVRVWLDSVFVTSQLQGQKDTRAAAGLMDHAVRAERTRLESAWDEKRAADAIADESVCSTNDFRFARMYLLHKLSTQNAEMTAKRFQQFERQFRSARQIARLSDRSLGQLWIMGAALDLVRGQNPLSEYQAASNQSSDGHYRVLRYVARTEQDVAKLQELYVRRTVGDCHTGRE